MQRKHLIAAAIAVGLVTATSACTASSPAPTASSSASQPAEDGLAGTWTMTSLEDSASGEYQAIPYSGQIVFSPTTVSVQAMNPDAEAADGPYTIGGYEAFYGPLTVDAGAGTFSVDVESAAVRALIGQTVTRDYAVDGDTLVLTPVDPAETWRVTYERES